MTSRSKVLLSAAGALLFVWKFRSIRRYIAGLLFKREVLKTIPWIDDTTHGGLIAAHVLKVGLHFSLLLFFCFLFLLSSLFSLSCRR